MPACGSSTTAPPSTSSTPACARSWPSAPSLRSPPTSCCPAPGPSPPRTSAWPAGSTRRSWTTSSGSCQRNGGPAPIPPCTSSTWPAACAGPSPRRPRVPAPPRRPFAYAILGVVPSVARGERINAGVVLFSRQHRFLAARVGLDERRLTALSPAPPAAQVRPLLDAIARVAAGDPEAGPIAALPPSERFGWIVAASSTVIQPLAVHTGLCEDPARTLDELFADLVA